MADTPQSDRFKQFSDSVFNTAGLPEVAESDLEPGTYTNAQIAEKLKGDPMKLLQMCMQVSNMDSPATKRSILSFAVDMLDSIKQIVKEK